MKFGIDGLRNMVKQFNYCNETFLQKYSIQELIKIGKALSKIEWDYLPDQWTEKQINDALNDRVPQWDSEGNPI